MPSPAPEPLEPVGGEMPICADCGLPKQRLRRLTEKKHEPIFVCVQKTAKSKMPCDGWVWEVSERNG